MKPSIRKRFRSAYSIARSMGRGRAFATLKASRFVIFGSTGKYRGWLSSPPTPTKGPTP